MKGRLLFRGTTRSLYGTLNIGGHKFTALQEVSLEKSYGSVNVALKARSDNQIVFSVGAQLLFGRCELQSQVSLPWR